MDSKLRKIASQARLRAIHDSLLATGSIAETARRLGVSRQLIHRETVHRPELRKAYLAARSIDATRKKSRKKREEKSKGG